MAILGGTYGNVTNTYWLSGVNCQGTESYIGDCAHAPWGSSNNCPYYRAASVSCLTPPPANPPSE